MNKKSQLQFAQRCAILLESGIPLPEALVMIEQLETNKNNKSTLEIISRSVKEGISLSKSITFAKTKFDPTLFSMISFGESAGTLAVSIRQGLNILEKSGHIKKKLISSLVYPGFIALATIGMTGFLVMYIFPKIIPLFSSMNIKLPFLTRLVRALYEGTLAYGFYVVILTVILATVFILLYKKKAVFRLRTQLILLCVPIIGAQLKKYHITSSCRSIGTLLECGQTLPKILVQIKAAATSEVYRNIWYSVEEKAKEGVVVSALLRKFPQHIPHIVPDMLSIGEKTGSLSSMFIHISRMYEEELEDFCKQLSTSIEPVLMIGMGLIVGSVALSIILPIYEVTNHLTH